MSFPGLCGLRFEHCLESKKKDSVWMWEHSKEKVQSKIVISYGMSAEEKSSNNMPVLLCPDSPL